MKRQDVGTLQAEGKPFVTHVIRNPARSGEWIVFFQLSTGRSFFLIDEHDEVESFRQLDRLIEVLQRLGIKLAEIHF
ncbi:hypothetical protein SAMN04244572_03064 [Azotobacter beijerinckii]|uniref:Uncharacterized protein n=1 Tax=Azotobacter beijerinckii TaxID=170623 RepID=A0A1H6UU80_9GAMM|nr:hypothetical protein [Azotobacter beijerinckii]SEI91615.1 hypothetical protein SAMN04244579_02446 [Azotobacter beijerinckii]SEJ19112.1 hypothetical protein SAMN04244572_03064 [Azotobacter beijerinckii]SEQ89200.1 hypothetical protein SAMN04244573_02453 [Azotobacter beijerinckii]SFB50160.1 hypothetical protein SAMN04244571_03298 [Azotobacter beijerinckii]SFK85894.1 hypothetical protein SAMN04244574_02126 [Azotobacter beijerinckii]